MEGVQACIDASPKTQDKYKDQKEEEEKRCAAGRVIPIFVEVIQDKNGSQRRD